MQTKHALVLVLALSAIACQKVERVELQPKQLLFTTANQTANVTASAFNGDSKAMEGVQFTFSSSDAAIASVEGGGKVTAHKSGTATITAKAGEKSDTASVEVKIPAKLELTGGPFTIVGLGNTAAFEAKVLDDAGRAIEGATVNVAVADPAIATAAEKSITGIAPGTTKVTASFGALTAETELTVKLPDFASVTLEPATTTVKLGSTAMLTAAIKAADGSGVAGVPIAFTTSDDKIATVDAGGKITPVAPGKAKITATAGDKTASVEVVVKK